MSLKNKVLLAVTFFFGFVAELIVLGWIANATELAELSQLASKNANFSKARSRKAA